MVRNRTISEVDPLDESPQEQGDVIERQYSNYGEPHDFFGSSTVPDDIHLTRTRSRRGSSFIRPINTLLGRTEVPEDEEELSTPIREAITEEDDQEVGYEPKISGRSSSIQNNQEFKLDPDFRKQSVATLPNTHYVKNSSDDIEDKVSDDGVHSQNPKLNEFELQPPETLEKVETTKSVRYKRNKKLIFKVAFMFGKIYLITLAVFMLILSVYWASLYDTTSHLKNIPFLVVSGEDEVDQIPPLISETLIGLLNSTKAQAVGKFTFSTKESFLQLANEHNTTIEEEIVKQVHDLKYWASFYVLPNATLQYFEALSSANSSFNTTPIQFIYETSMNPTGVSSYLIPVANKLETFFKIAAAETVSGNIIKELSTSKQLKLATNASNLLDTMGFQYIDNRPSPKAMVLGPIQLGLVYLVVLSFHQFNFASATHELIRTKLVLRQYMVYHIITSQGAYFVLSLFYCLMAVAFQISTSKTFGTSGFLVMWSIVFLTMSALGGISENVALQIFARNKAFIGFWVTSFMTLNLSVISSPMIIMNRFFRYGYAAPLYNCQELLKVTLLNTYKGDMGRHFGILIAWIVLVNCLLPFTLKSTDRYKKRVAARAEKASEKQK